VNTAKRSHREGYPHRRNRNVELVALVSFPKTPGLDASCLLVNVSTFIYTTSKDHKRQTYSVVVVVDSSVVVVVLVVTSSVVVVVSSTVVVVVVVLVVVVTSSVVVVVASTVVVVLVVVVVVVVVEQAPTSQPTRVASHTFSAAQQ